MKAFFTAVLFLFANILGATTIIPNKNLAEMARHSDLVALIEVIDLKERDLGEYFKSFTQVKVVDLIKGTAHPQGMIELRHMSHRTSELMCSVYDDVNLEVGSSYLVFLSANEDGTYYPRMMTYGVFKSMEHRGQNYLSPISNSLDMNILKTPEGTQAEPLAVYHQDQLISHLKDVLSGQSIWNMEEALFTKDVRGFNAAFDYSRMAPSHCSFQNNGSSTNPIVYRWNGFPTNPVNVVAENDGDPDCTAPIDTLDPITYVADAVADLQTNYMGITLTAGTWDFTPNCNGGAYQGNYTGSFPNSRYIGVQFSDPCNQIADLSGCSGVLAIGGSYGFTPPQTYDNLQYYPAAWGWVIVNDSFCNCFNAIDYKYMLTHEISHALGMGHIMGSGNMNITCCSPIGSLDIQCFDYYYPPQSLSVDFEDFSAKAVDNHVALSWATSNEVNNKEFRIQRSNGNSEFRTIQVVAPAEDGSQLNRYSAIDLEPMNGVNYYRIQQVDFDGTETYTNIIPVIFNLSEWTIQVLGNPTSDEAIKIRCEAPIDDFLNIQLIDNLGRSVYNQSSTINFGDNTLTVPIQDLPNGIYVLSLYNNTVKQSQMIVVER